MSEYHWSTLSERILNTTQGALTLDTPHLMGIINATPDSFYAPSRINAVDQALQLAETHYEAGAQWLDIGGESSRPGSQRINAQTTLDRVLPIIKAIKQRFKIYLSIDTYHPEVMHAAVHEGVDLINDIKALRHPGALSEFVQQTTAGCLMHMQGTPETMQQAPHYDQDDVMSALEAFFKTRLQQCIEHGIDLSRILIDPGFGFGKSIAHNWTILRQLSRLKQFNRPILVGLSRKHCIRAQLKDPDDTFAVGLGSSVAAGLAYLNGAHIIRTHDVEWARHTLAIMQAYHTQPENCL
ncbi:MAG: dihydropteroate synthase [Legionellales bacterium]|nr:dihydropteroate synthase [Legionellales bacterium]